MGSATPPLCQVSLRSAEKYLTYSFIILLVSSKSVPDRLTHIIS
jgi:hypothetical protein